MLTTNAHIGNYGVNYNDIESDSIKISGLVCKNFSFNYSRDNAQDSLENYFKKHGLLAISDIDTRAVVSYIRDKGAMNAIISTDLDLIVLKEKLKLVPNMDGLELASKVSTKEPYFYGDENATYKISALDIGIKKNILRNLAKRDCYIKVFPYNSTFDEMNAFNPDGFFLSNGPGDPTPLKEAQEVAKEIIKRNFPLFGICLGHQVIALANGISTYKMHNGHRGINHPVKNLITGKGEITSQNHGFGISVDDVNNNKFDIISDMFFSPSTTTASKSYFISDGLVAFHGELLTFFQTLPLLLIHTSIGFAGIVILGPNPKPPKRTNLFWATTT